MHACIFYNFANACIYDVGSPEAHNVKYEINNISGEIYIVILDKKNRGLKGFVKPQKHAGLKERNNNLNMKTLSF